MTKQTMLIEINQYYFNDGDNESMSLSSKVSPNGIKMIENNPYMRMKIRLILEALIEKIDSYPKESNKDVN